MVSRYLVEIDELVLDGVAAADRDRVAAAFGAELTRLLLRDGLPADVESRSAAALSGVPALSPTQTPRALGAALARAVHRGLTRSPERHAVPRGPGVDRREVDPINPAAPSERTAADPHHRGGDT